MNTHGYLTATHATANIDSRVREAKNYRLVAEARRTSRTRRPKLFVSLARPWWFPRARDGRTRRLAQQSG